MLVKSKDLLKDKNKMIDIIVIGGGAAGMTAALYALRSGKKVLVLEKENFGGQIANSPRVENFPSIKEISGVDLSNNMFEQITDLGAEFELENVLKIEKNDFSFTVTTDYNTYEAKAVIIASGVHHRKIGVEHEDELVGKGVSYCAVCDGAFYKDQDVALIGDANTALQYALLLSNYCRSVHICTLFDHFFGEDILVKRIKERPNIKVTHNLSLQKFNFHDTLESLEFMDTFTHEKVVVPCECVFIAIGQVPENDNFTNLVDLDKGYIVTNDACHTKTDGLFAAGDCRKKSIRQLTTAVSDGAIAAIEAVNYIDSKA